MTPERDEALLREAGDQHRDARATQLPDSTLNAYRGGSLSDRERRHVEWRLTRDGASRRRLIDLSEVDPPDRLAQLRRSVLRDLRRQRQTRRWRLLAAATAAAVVVVAVSIVGIRLGGLGDASSPSAPLPEFTVRLEALTNARDGSLARIEAEPDSTVRIYIEPEAEPRPGLHFGLYRASLGGLERIGPSPTVPLERNRGAARFRGEARHLVSSDRPGTEQLWVAVAPNELPPTVATPTASPADALRQATGGRVYAVELILRAPAERETNETQGGTR